MPLFFKLIFGGAMLISAGCIFVATVSSVQDRRFPRGAVPLIATTLSLIWVALGLLWHGAFGPDYTKLQYSIISINLFAMVAAAVPAGAIRSQRSWLTIPAALILACVWLYIGAIKSVAG